MKTEAQMRSTRASDSLCMSCQHSEVCRMKAAIDVEEDSRSIYLVVISQCYHHLPTPETPAADEVIR